MNRLRIFLFSSVAAMAVALTACGGGGGSSPTPTSPGSITQPSAPPATLSLSTNAVSGTKDTDFYGYADVTGNASYVLPFNWTMTGLPSGVTVGFGNFNNTRVYWQGVATVAGTFPVHVVVRDSSPGQPVKIDTTVTFTIDTAFKFVRLTTPRAVVNSPYSFGNYVANGTPPFHFEVYQGTLPAGLSLDPVSGVIAGTPTSDFPYFNLVGLKVTDSSTPPKTIQDLFSFFVNPVLRFNGQQSVMYLRTQNYISVNVQGGLDPYHVKIVSGSLPPGTSIADPSSSVQLMGSPTQLGVFNADIEVTDSYSPANVVTGTLTIYVNSPPPHVVVQLPHGIVGVPYSYSVAADNGTRPLTWTASNLPDGLTMNSNGDISGTPTTAGLKYVSFQVTDSSLPSPYTASSNSTVTIKPAFTGRNDSIATATPLTTNGSDAVFIGNLSPYANGAGVAQPDQDFYKLTVAPGTTFKVLVEAGFYRDGFFYTGGNTDPVVEFQDANGQRVSNCRLPGQATFSQPCMNDDIIAGLNRNSQLELQNTGATDLTVYVRILDWGGRARPDLGYKITVSGAK